MPIDAENMALSLIERLYGGILDDADWIGFLRALRDVLHCRSATLLTHGNTPHMTPIVLYSDPDQALLNEYNAWYADRNPLVEEGTRRGILALGRLACSLEVIPRDRWVKTEIYNDYFAPQGIDYCYGMTIDLGRGVYGTLSLDMQPGREPLTASEQWLLRVIRPHVQRAFGLACDLRRLAAERDCLAESVDRLGCGFIALDRSGRALMMNPGARAILGHGDGLTMDREGRLRCEDPVAGARLGRLIGSALSTSRSGSALGGGAMRVARTSGDGTFGLLVTPLRASRDDPLCPQPCVGVYLSDSESSFEPSHRVLGDLYGLTNAESRTVAGLVAGLNVSEIAERRGLSRETVRFQLKQAFAKTQTRSQAELVGLVLGDTAARAARAQADPIKG